MSISDDMNKDVASILDSSDVDLSESLNTGVVTNTDSFVATNEKLFTETAGNSTSAPKTFSIHETKQIVNEINFDPGVPEKTKLLAMNKDALTNLQNATGMTITDDASLEKAQKSVMGKLVDMKNSSANLISSGMSSVGKAVTTVTEAAMAAKVYTTDSAVNLLLPEGMDKGTFTQMRSDFATYLKSFNTCPDVSALFDFNVEMYDYSELTDKIKKFFETSSELDFSNLFACLSGGFGLLKMADKQGIIAKAVKTGSISSVGSAVDTVGSNIIQDTVGTAFGSLKNFSGKLSDETNSDLADNVLNKLGVDKTKLLNVGNGERILNDGITSKIGSPVVSTSKVAEASVSKSGIGAWSAGSYVDNLIKKMPGIKT